MFRQVRHHFPGLSAYVEASYGTQAFLFFGKSTILSCLGVHQGDPLALLLFALVLHVLIGQIRNLGVPFALNNWFADDGILAGPANSLASAIDVIRDEGPYLGLHLSAEKSSFWQGDRVLPADPIHRGIPPVSPEGFELLGAPIGCNNFIFNSLNNKVDRIAEVTDKLHLTDDPQAEFCLLRSCLSLPKFEYSARVTNPEFHASSMRRFDGLMRESLGSVLGHSLDDKQWEQASLPVSMGGMGLRRATAHSPAAYVSSVAHSFDLTSEILSPIKYNPFGINLAIDILNSSVDEPFNFHDLKSTPKRQITHAIDQRLRNSVVNDATSINDRVRLAGVAKSRASAWLNVVPSYGLGNSMQSQDFRCAALYRLGAPIFERDSDCPACGRISDRYGHYAIGCAVNG